MTSSAITGNDVSVAQPAQVTEYVVLRENLVPVANSSTALAGTHSVVKTVKARSAADAIRQAAGKQEGTYRAVPARSFQPVKVTVETTTTIKLD